MILKFETQTSQSLVYKPITELPYLGNISILLIFNVLLFNVFDGHDFYSNLYHLKLLAQFLPLKVMLNVNRVGSVTEGGKTKIVKVKVF